MYCNARFVTNFAVSKDDIHCYGDEPQSLSARKQKRSLDIDLSKLQQQNEENKEDDDMFRYPHDEEKFENDVGDELWDDRSDDDVLFTAFYRMLSVPDGIRR